jgi:hypothetical protein
LSADWSQLNEVTDWSDLSKIMDRAVSSEEKKETKKKDPDPKPSAEKQQEGKVFLNFHDAFLSYLVQFWTMCFLCDKSEEYHHPLKVYMKIIS